MSVPRQQKCGIGGCQPGCMRRFGTINWFTGFYSTSGLFTSSLSVYIASQITTIERQFGLSSTKSGYLMACNDIGFSVFVLLAGYLASRVHVPRFLAISAILYGISGIVCSVPHFIASTDSYVTVLSLQNETISNSKFTPPLCNVSSSPVQEMSPTVTDSIIVDDIDDVAKTSNVDFIQDISFALIAIGMVLQGLAKSARQPLVSQFLDDNTEKEETGMYMGIITSCAIFGPAIAFGLGGYFSQIYVTLEDVALHPRDPRWVGAWWLGFLSFGALAIVFGIPLLFFPSRLTARPLRGEEIVEKVEDRTQDHKTLCQCLGVGVTGIFRSIAMVMKSKLYCLCLLATIINVLGMAASMSFIPKYIEISFNVPTWQANVIIAAVGIISTCLGSFLGGWLTKRVKLNPPRCIMMIFATQIFSIIAGFIIIFIHCDQPLIHNAPPGLGRGFSTNSTCGGSCDCTGTPYLPICGSDNINYFSPCHAGCLSGSLHVFTNCTCIPGGEASTGLCEFDCNMLLPFCVIVFVSNIVASTMMMPTFILLLRSVPNEVKSMGVGISSLTMSLLAFMPGPVIGGKLIDATCLQWSVKGSCNLYDITSLRFNLFGMGITCRCIAVIIYVIAIFFSWNMSKWPSEVTKRRSLKRHPETDVLMDKYKYRE